MAKYSNESTADKLNTLQRNFFSLVAQNKAYELEESFIDADIRPDGWVLGSNLGSIGSSKNIDETFTNENGQTLLMVATLRGCADTVAVLVNYGANPLYSSKGNDTAYKIADKANNHDIINYFNQVMTNQVAKKGLGALIGVTAFFTGLGIVAGLGDEIMEKGGAGLVIGSVAIWIFGAFLSALLTNMVSDYATHPTMKVNAPNARPPSQMDSFVGQE